MALVSHVAIVPMVPEQIDLPFDLLSERRDARVAVENALPLSRLKFGSDGVGTCHGLRDEPLCHERRGHDHDEANSQDTYRSRQIGVLHQ